MTVGIVGLGLIGGSMAKAVKSRTDCRVLGFDRDAASRDCALREGACDGILDSESLGDCELVLVAPFRATIPGTDTYMDRLR